LLPLLAGGLVSVLKQALTSAGVLNSTTLFSNDMHLVAANWLTHGSPATVIAFVQRHLLVVQVANEASFIVLALSSSEGGTVLSWPTIREHAVVTEVAVRVNLWRKRVVLSHHSQVVARRGVDRVSMLLSMQQNGF